ncbi:hypothetical protein [Streptomyces cahuitamycinicus]|uniref:hypothetical protein n=1 Tax=Streptomyces cahuitamycinicus TaxID=2070367 RepID=UPI001FE5F3DE|nr:hypothetical protein [Streptomyces cahuitamycinicus]
MGMIRASEWASPLAYAQGSPMLPEVRPHVSTALADQLDHQLDLDPHLEAAQLDVKRVAGIAVVAAAHSDGYAATGHLLGLLAALPAPTKAGERFWSDLWRSSGTAYLLPVNIKAPVLRSLAGEGTALARQVFSAVDEMTPPPARRGRGGDRSGPRRVRPSARPQVTGHRGTVTSRSRAHRLARPARRPQVGPPGWTESLPGRLDERLSVGSFDLHGSRAGHAAPVPDDACSD